MRKTIKNLIFIAILVLTVLSLSVLVGASVPKDDLVVDNDNVFSNIEEKNLENSLFEVSNKHQCELAIVTVSSFGGKSAKQYAENYYDNNGYGYGSDATGVLLLLSVTKREYYICLTGEAVEIFDYSAFNRLDEAVYSRAKNDDFYGVATTFVSVSDSIISEYKAENIDTGFDKNVFVTGIIISLIVGLIAATIALLIMKSKMNNAKPQKNAGRYIRNGSFNLTTSRDMYLYSTVRKVARPQNNNRGGSSGRSRGGGGRRF